MPILEKTYENVINQPEKTRITLNVKTKKIDIKDFTNYNIRV